MLGPGEILDLLRIGATTRVEDAARRPLFLPGQRVLTRKINPLTHTRLPRYCRGRRGVIDRVHGLYALPDLRALGDETTREYCYSVRFTMRELWGEDASPVDSLLIDLWDSYLLPDAAGEP
ncbi:SH3-like domain-containing protein [Ancylobacter terrae]|uniref:SH3-like domain-containing protein n=1 Tax=Ancylobacter sp. sgz301288 TaxID=3342077 RepID=UPI00385EBC36